MSFGKKENEYNYVCKMSVSYSMVPLICRKLNGLEHGAHLDGL